MQLGHWEKALANGLRGWQMEPSAIFAGNLTLIHLALGQADAARATLEDAFARGWDAFYLHLQAYQEAFLRDDRDAMRRHVEAVAGREGEEDFLIAAQADTEAFQGRHDRARELSRRAVVSAKAAGTLEMAGSWEAQAAFREALIGEGEDARSGAHAALEISEGKYVVALSGLALALTGDAPGAESAVTTLERDHPQNTLMQRNWIPCIRSALALERKDWKAALDALEIAEPLELGITLPFEAGFMIPVYLRGLALAGARRPVDAKREMMKIVERPTLIRNFIIYPLARAFVAPA
jgi:hypothetical protein